MILQESVTWSGPVQGHHGGRCSYTTGTWGRFIAEAIASRGDQGAMYRISRAVDRARQLMELQRDFLCPGSLAVAQNLEGSAEDGSGRGSIAGGQQGGGAETPEGRSFPESEAELTEEAQAVLEAGDRLSGAALCSIELSQTMAGECHSTAVLGLVSHRQAVLELDTGRVHLAGATTNPNGVWVTQQARNLLLVLGERGRHVRFLVRDRDQKFCRGFDDVFRAEGAEVLVTPVQAPNANAYAERWVRTVRAECLDWLLIVSRGHLEQILRRYVEHYNQHRPHRALGLEPPDPSAGLALVGEARGARVNRRDLLGGLLHEYRRAA
jgi:Integrase core domain